MDGYIRNADEEIAAFQPIWSTLRDRLIFCRQKLEDLIDEGVDYTQIVKGKPAISRIDEELKTEPMKKERRQLYNNSMNATTLLLAVIASANAAEL